MACRFFSWGIWALLPWPGIKPGPLHWEYGILLTGPPRKSQKGGFRPSGKGEWLLRPLNANWAPDGVSLVHSSGFAWYCQRDSLCFKGRKETTWLLVLDRSCLFHSPPSSSSRDSLVPLGFLPLQWYHPHIWGCWCFSYLSWFQLVTHLAQHFSWCERVGLRLNIKRN